MIRTVQQRAAIMVAMTSRYVHNTSPQQRFVESQSELVTAWCTEYNTVCHMFPCATGRAPEVIVG